MSPTTLYDPEVITTTAAISTANRDALQPKFLNKQGPTNFQKFRAALFVVPSILVLCAVVLLAAEVTLGLFGLGDDEYIKIDPILGISHLENKWVDFRQEGFAREKISSTGLRDVEHQLAKPKGVTRIAFIGDSKTQAMQVPIADTFVRLVENNLNAQNEQKAQQAQPGQSVQEQKFETINFGMSSYGIVQYFVNYLTRVRPYAPDVTVVVYNIFDSTENFPKFGTVTLPAPTLSANNKDELTIDYNFMDGWLHGEGVKFMIASEWLRRNCHLFQALCADDFMLRSSSKWYVSTFNALFAPFSGSFENEMASIPLSKLGNYEAQRKAVCDETRALDKQVSHDKIWTWTVQPRLGDVNAAGADGQESFKMLHDAASADVNLVGRIVRMLNKACSNSGSKLVIVTLPSLDNMVFYYKEIKALKKLGAQEGITIIDATEQFPSLAPMQKSPLYYSAHFSPAGHRKLASIITEGLKPILKQQ